MANKKYYFRPNQKKKNPPVALDPELNAAASAVAVEDLELSQSTLELLTTNNFKTCADIIKNTEKDMYRVQTLNKRVLMEITAALAKKDLKFMEPTPNIKDNRNRAVRDKNQGEREKNANGQAAPVQAQASRQPFGDRRRRDQTPNVAKKNNEADRRVKENLPGRKFFTLSGKLRQGEGRPTYNKAVERERVQTCSPLPPEDWRKVQRGTKWGFYDGIKTVIPPMYDEVFHFKEGLASVELEEKCGYIDTENNIVIPFDYETALSFSNGLAVVMKSGMCGYIDKENNKIIDFVYDAATSFEADKARVKKDGKWGVIDKDGAVKWNSK